MEGLENPVYEGDDFDYDDFDDFDNNDDEYQDR